MQDLSTIGFENVETNELDIIKCEVKNLSFENTELKVHHVGWISITFNSL